MSSIDFFPKGVLNNIQLQMAIDNDFICRDKQSKVGEDELSAFDLLIGDDIWEMKGSVKPNGKEYYSTLKIYSKKKISLSGYFILKKGHVYVANLQETFNFDYNLFAEATGKSSIGRLDVLTRLIADNNQYFDSINKNTSGNLYVEIIPLSYNVEIKPGDKVNQLRICSGSFDSSLLKQNDDLLNHNNKPVLTNADDLNHLSLNINPHKMNIRAFEAIKTSEPIRLDYEKASIHASDYFRVYPKLDKDNHIRIRKNRFYILVSEERFELNENVCVYCQAITENIGEIRIHYAGFVHPEFGLYRKDKRGTPLIFEVRGHSTDAFLRGREKIALLKYYKMSEPTNYGKGTPYSDQELKLSKCFIQDLNM